MEGTREEVAERALPFREGDEVLVHIVEPHMYDVDDAVAKIDGYIISVDRRRARTSGEKRLVRIDGGRAHGAAVATLVDDGDGRADGGEADRRATPPRRGR